MGRALLCLQLFRRLCVIHMLGLTLLEVLSLDYLVNTRMVDNCCEVRLYGGRVHHFLGFFLMS